VSNLIFAGNVVAPVFIIIFLGIILRRRGIVNDQFNTLTSKVVFNVALPAMIFKELSSFPLNEILHPSQVLLVVISLLVMFLFSWIVSAWLCHDGRDRGAFIQGSFRGNFAILGFALVRNAYGEEALGGAAIVLAIIMPIYNILSVIALTVPLQQEKQIEFVRILKTVATNPLILALLCALPFSLFDIPLHPIFSQSIQYLAALTLPLALISLGSSLSFHSIRQDRKLTIAATIIKLVIMPCVGVAAAVLAGFRGQELGILFFMFAAPTAIASYIMAEVMGSNGRLAGNIVLVSTIASLFTLSLGIFLLRLFNYF